MSLAPLLRCATLCAFLFAPPGVVGAAGVNELAEMVAPADLLATNFCATVAEQVFAPRMAEAVRGRRSPQSLASPDVRRLLEVFDRITAAFCEAAKVAARGKKAEIGQAFARSYAVAVDSPWQRFIDEPEARSWAAADAAFQVEVLPLIAHFALLNEIHPESLGDQLRGRVASGFAGIENPALRDSYQRMTTGTAALAYRRMIVLMLNDPGFAAVAPPRYRVKALAALHERLFERGVRATQGGPDFSSLESSFQRAGQTVQDLLAPALREPYLAALTALANAGQ
jgi:hypothetical protein